MVFLRQFHHINIGFRHHVAAFLVESLSPGDWHAGRGGSSWELVDPEGSASGAVLPRCACTHKPTSTVHFWGGRSSEFDMASRMMVLLAAKG